MKRAKTILSCFVFFTTTSATYYASTSLVDSIRMFQYQLDSIQIQLEKLSANQEDLSRKEKAALIQLDAIDKKIALTKDILKRLATQIELRNREINEVTAQLIKIYEQIQQRQNLLKKRVFAIYKYSRIYFLQSLVTSKNIPELYRRALNIRVISRQDRKLITEMSTLNRQAEQKRREILAARIALEKLNLETQEKQRALASARNEEANLLKKIRHEKETNFRVQQELKIASEKLHSLIDEIANRSPIVSNSDHYLERNKGKILWPVVGGTVIARFGSNTHSRYRTKTNNPGIDIKVRHTESIRVIAPGKVVYADRFIGYGNLVIVDHGDGYYSLYSNLTTVETTINAELNSGAYIGTVDDYLHFEIRKEGQPVNPLGYLIPE
ncbi:MAG: murein hydrolase activator EnvC family protein [bacterium]